MFVDRVGPWPALLDLEVTAQAGAPLEDTTLTARRRPRIIPQSGIDVPLSRGSPDAFPSYLTR